MPEVGESPYRSRSNAPTTSALRVFMSARMADCSGLNFPADMTDISPLSSETNIPACRARSISSLASIFTSQVENVPAPGTRRGPGRPPPVAFRRGAHTGEGGDASGTLLLHLSEANPGARAEHFKLAVNGDRFVGRGRGRGPGNPPVADTLGCRAQVSSQV